VRMLWRGFRLTDGEAVACDDQGTPVFKLLIRNRLYASAWR
jgi:hypothetical protein